ncbi:MAG: hypothetical protein ACOCY0_04605 [Roseicyclus sp.]
MTPAELRATFARLGWTVAAAGRRWGVPQRTLHDWLAGKARVPPLVDHLARLETGEARPWHEVAAEAATVQPRKDRP